MSWHIGYNNDSNTEGDKIWWINKSRVMVGGVIFNSSVIENDRKMYLNVCSLLSFWLRLACS